MPIGIIRGPAGAGKSQWFEANREPGDLIIDVSGLWVALLGLERDGNGRYPVRLATDPGLRMAALSEIDCYQVRGRERNQRMGDYKQFLPGGGGTSPGADRLWRRRWRSRARGHCGPWRVCGAFQAGGP